MPMSLQVSSGICTSFRPKRCGSPGQVGHLALRYALAKELVHGGAGVQDSADGAILHKQMQSLQLAITLGERAGLFWAAERGQHRGAGAGPGNFG